MTLPLLQELTEVLVRPKFVPLLSCRNIYVADLLGGVVALVAFYEPSEVTGVVPDDPDDDAVIACAVAAQARWIVSGDDHLLQLGCYQGICIGSPRDFLATEFPNRL